MCEQEIFKESLKNLKDWSNSKDASSGDVYIDVLNDYFDKSRQSAEIAYVLELMFKESDQKLDIQKIISRSLSRKELEKCCISLLELVKKLIELFPSYIRPYSDYLINKCCIPVVKVAKSGARYKEICLKVIHQIVSAENVDTEEVAVEQLIKDVMSVFNQPVKSGLFCAAFELIGKFSKSFPEKFNPQDVKIIRNSMLTKIQNLFKDDKANVSLQLVGGAVQGLKDFLENFTPSFDDDPQFPSKLYECMKQLSDPNQINKNTEHNRVAFRSMLSIVHTYGHLVGPSFFQDYKHWQDALQKWVDSKTYDDKLHGLQAIQTFHEEVGKELMERKNENDRIILQSFMNRFKLSLQSSEASPHEIRVAIHGFGCMAGACNILMEPKYLYEQFDLIMQRVEYSYDLAASDKMKRRDVLQNLPVYVESLSKIMNQLNDGMSGIQIQSLESVIVLLIKDFPYLSTAHHNLVVMCLFETFLNLEKAGGKILEDILESVIWQGVLWTCSHQLVYDLELKFENVSDWKETITYRRYLPLWQQLLTPKNEKYKRMSFLVYGCFVKNLFNIIEKLDLSTKRRKYTTGDINEDDIEFSFTDPSLDLEPVRAENFQILYNLVQLYNDVISRQSQEDLKYYFIDWLELWFEKSIQLSTRYFLVSAFLQIIEIAVKIIARFDENEVNDANIIEPLKYFIKLLFPRCREISGEYQVAMLQLIFQAPASSILKDYALELIPIFKLGFTIGRSILNVAHLALECFENLLDVLSEEPITRRKLLEANLPLLECFLSNKELSVGIEGGMKFVKYGKNQRKRAIPQSIETDLMRLKKKIFLFFGRCSPEEAQLVLANSHQELVRSYIEEIFSVKLESNENCMLIVYLDQIFERVQSLALASSDRATKISACELLHALMLYFMGKNLERNETLSLWKQLCCTIITLGADEDQTVCQLFEPLLFQIMHYFSHPNKILSPLSTALIESLMLMISNNNNCIQDLSARLLREFITWLLRQTTRDQRGNSPVRLVDLFQELKKMSIETNQSRRIGAALAFNNIYRIIREEEVLVNVYWIYLLDVFCTNFKTSEISSENLDNFFIDERRFEQLSMSLNHLMRVFIERSSIFQLQDYDRIRPAEFKGIMLNDVIEWLFTQCASYYYHYSRKCREMFTKLLTTSSRNFKAFYELNFDLKKLIEIGEGGINGLANEQTIDEISPTIEPIFKKVYEWTKKFLASIEFYIWILEHKVLSEIENFVNTSIILKVCEYFLNKDLTQSINANSTQASYEMKMNNQNLEKIDVMRCILTVRIIDFLTLLIEQGNINEFLDNNQNQLTKVLSRLIFKPTKLSFDYRTQNIVQNKSERIIKFILAVNENSQMFKVNLTKKLQDKMIRHLNGFCEKSLKIMDQRNVNEFDKNKLKGIDLLITSDLKPILIEENSLMFQELVTKSFEVLLQCLSNNIFEESIDGFLRPKRLSPSVKQFACRMMKTCLHFDPQFMKIFICCVDDNLLKVSNMNSIRKGEYFLGVYKEPIFEVFTMDINQCFNLLVMFLTMEEASMLKRLEIVNMMTDLNKYVYDHLSGDTQLLENSLHVTIAHWPTILKCLLEIDNDLNRVDLAIIDFVKHIAMCTPYDLYLLGQRLENFKNWLLELLKNKSCILDVKSKAVFLLPCITHADDINNEELKSSLEIIQKTHFPLRSSELLEGTLERIGYIGIVKNIFQALLTSKSSCLYRFIIDISINDEKFLLESHLQRVQKEFMENLTEKQQIVVLNQTFDLFVNAKYDPIIRLSVVSRYLLLLMKNAHVDTMLSFIQQRIGQIWILLTESKFYMDMEMDLINVSGVFLIIEAFFAAVPFDKIEIANFSIGGILSTGKELSKKLTLKTRNVRNDVTLHPSEPQHIMELFRKFQCYAYRALATIITSTSPENPEVYNLSLFKEILEQTDRKQKMFIWRHLVDCSRDDLYDDWSQDFEEFPKIKEYIVSVKEMNVHADAEELTKKKKYITSLSIFDRSLSQTLTKSDLSYSVVMSSQEAANKKKLITQNQHQKTMKIALESTPINDHEVMGHLVAVIHFMYAQKAVVFFDYEKHSANKYGWAVSIAESLTHISQPKNVKIFLLKMIENCRTIFVNYAKLIAPPILSLLSDETFVTKLNFFVTDLITMLISWSHKWKPSTMQEKYDAGKLLNFLLSNAYNERHEIFKLNLELLKKLVESWSEVLADKISFQTLYGMIDDKEKVLWGIQLNAIILANGLTPWENEDGRKTYVEAILKTFKNEKSNIYQAGAQLLGLCLNIVVKENNSEEILDLVKERLEGLKNDRTKNNLLMELLYGIHKGHPEILDSFKSRVESNIGTAVRKKKCVYLEMFMARLETYSENEIYRTLESIKIRLLLKQAEYQRIAMHIINKSLDKLCAKGKFMEYFNEIRYVLSSQDPEIRRLAIEIVINAVEKLKDEPAEKHRLTIEILKGFSDTNLEIQNRVMSFFNQNNELPNTFGMRFQQLLTNYYDPSLENEFLHYATHLLLDVSVNHPLSKTQPLLSLDNRNNCNYFEIPIITRSITHKSLPPIFIKSQQKQFHAGEGSQAMIQASLASGTTNDHLVFAPTLDPSVMSQIKQTFDLTHTQTSLLIPLKKKLLDRQSNFLTPQSQANDIQSQIEMAKEKPDDSSLDYLRRRVVKISSGEQSRQYAMKAIDRKEFTNASLKEKVNQLKQQASEVVLYRRYRYGDFPDFYFNALALLLPLKSLVKKDNSIARDIFITIFESIIKTYQESEDKEGETAFITTINEAIIRIVKSTQQSHSFLVSTLIEMTMKTEVYLDIDPDDLKILPANGILFLESQISHLLAKDKILENERESQEEEEEAERPSKRQKLDENFTKHQQHWLKLIEYNYQMKEYEVITGIFMEKLNLRQDIKAQLLRCIDFESDGKHKDARIIYKQLLLANDDRNQHEKQFYYNSYFNCLANLSDWKEVLQDVQQQLSGYNEIWTENTPFHQNTLLPQLIKGELRMTLNEEHDDNFFAVFEDWLNDDTKRVKLLKRFPEEIAMLNVRSEEFALCCVELEDKFKIFFNEWCSMEMYDDKFRLLQSVRNLAEIFNFANLMTTTQQQQLVKRREKLYLDWQISEPKRVDSIIHWNDLIAYRKEFNRQLGDDSRNAERFLIDAECKLLDVAFLQRNTDAAQVLLKKLKSLIFSDSASIHNRNILKCNLSITKYNVIVAENKFDSNYMEALQKLGNAWKKLNEGVLDRNAVNEFLDIKIEALCRVSDITSKLMTIYQKVGVIEEVPKEMNEGFLYLCNDCTESMEIDGAEDNLVKQLLKSGEKSLRRACLVASDYVKADSTPERELVLGNVFFKLGQYYRKTLMNFTDEDENSQQIQLEMIKAIFRAITFGVQEARFYLPYILILPALKSNLITNEFNEEIELVPLWMFISNISQILSNFDFEEDCYLDMLIIALAQKYPNAIYFPFKLSRENLSELNGIEAEKSIVKAIDKILSQDIMEKFSSALQCLVTPQKLLESHFYIFRHKISDDMTDSQFKKAIDVFHNDVFVRNKTCKGHEFMKINSFETKILHIAKLKWSANQKEIKKAIESLDLEIGKNWKKYNHFIDLGKLSKWLDEFKWTGQLEGSIEIPGQYRDEKPFLENHVKIVRFEQRLKIFNSKQLPVELKMLGSDGKVYSFIVKYGEDLRQDQRIQQVLKLLSSKLSLDRSCKQNQLHIETYQVIPINVHSGMLQNVNNALTISNFMEEVNRNLMTTEYTFNDVNAHICKELLNVLKKNEPLQGWQKIYENVVLKRDREELLNKFRECQLKIPSDIIPRALRNLSKSLSSYYILRKNFIKSLATMNIAHWILGIGDRHLSNIMLDVLKGNLIGIDFGIAFGAAATLQVPELIPFRLTSHFVSVLEPIGINGLFKKSMLHAFKCFRDHKELILICLEVFIKEPTLDWLLRAKIKSNGNVGGSQCIWDPKERIKIVEEKLSGANPMKLLMTEIRACEKKNEKLLAAYDAMIRGPNDGLRAKRYSATQQVLTPEDQISILISLATDETILATTYVGWNSWF